jgi:hypothetical protein
MHIRTGGLTMRVLKINEVKKEAISSTLFTGPNVTRQALLPDSREFNVTVVNFGGRGAQQISCPRQRTNTDRYFGKRFYCHRNGEEGDHDRGCCYYSRWRKALAWGNGKLGVLPYFCFPIGEPSHSIRGIGVFTSGQRPKKSTYIMGA